MQIILCKLLIRLRLFYFKCSQTSLKGISGDDQNSFVLPSDKEEIENPNGVYKNSKTYTSNVVS